MKNTDYSFHQVTQLDIKVLNENENLEKENTELKMNYTSLLL